MILTNHYIGGCYMIEDIRKIKQVIILRKDLNMRKGKMVAQGAHASMAAIINRGGIKHRESTSLVINMTPEMKEWLNGGHAKICVGCNSEEELIKLYEQAGKAGLLCSLIQDAGHTEFSGVPTYTAVAIGPAKAEDVDKVTGDLKLL